GCDAPAGDQPAGAAGAQEPGHPPGGDRGRAGGLLRGADRGARGDLHRPDVPGAAAALSALASGRCRVAGADRRDRRGAARAARVITRTANMYDDLVRTYLPSSLVGAKELALTAETGGLLLERLVRERLLEQIIEPAEDATRLISPDVPRPTSVLRTVRPEST